NEVDNIIIAVPCNALRSVLDILSDHGNDTYNICIACKGLAEGTHILNHQIVNECLGNLVNIAIISGPSFATEVANGLPTAVTIASENKE
ncbi:MAG: hypothetical protein GTN87_09815, partial [Hydrotalea flava]|nr:hypothetical protein [Hydrotalea flava]NIQ50835.1 hypothetical protein [Hydrotalea flava]